MEDDNLASENILDDFDEEDTYTRELQRREQNEKLINSLRWAFLGVLPDE